MHLKERRKLILVPRETPLSLIHLENMLTVTRAGAVVLPAMPGWYHRPRRLDDVINFVVARICDQLGIDNSLIDALGKRSRAGSAGRESLGSVARARRVTSRTDRGSVSRCRQTATPPCLDPAGSFCSPAPPPASGRPWHASWPAEKKARALVLTARRGDRLDQLAAELKTLQPGLEVLTIAADLADPATPERLVAETIARFGGLDVLINNAGLGLPTLFADSDPEHLARQLAVNFTAPLMLTRLCLPSLIERRGMIINIGSAITCVANSALGAYGATKAGLAYWNDALRRELYSKGVTVCLVEPGPIKTEFMDAVSSLVPAEQTGSSDPGQRRSLDDGRRRGRRAPRDSPARPPSPAAVGLEAVRLAVPASGRRRAALPAAGRPGGQDVSA